jgi:hypothetical protein
MPVEDGAVETVVERLAAVRLTWLADALFCRWSGVGDPCARTRPALPMSGLLSPGESVE